VRVGEEIANSLELGLGLVDRARRLTHDSGSDACLTRIALCFGSRARRATRRPDNRRAPHLVARSLGRVSMHARA